MNLLTVFHSDCTIYIPASSAGLQFSHIPTNTGYYLLLFLKSHPNR